MYITKSKKDKMQHKKRYCDTKCYYYAVCLFGFLMTKSDSCSRTIYKLEKAFQEPDVRDLAATVRERIEGFKDRMPVVMTLGNPGMKSRHWEQISAIVGIPIKFDPDLTLGKVLAMGLDGYIAQFESISEAATKENTLEMGMDKMHRDWTDMAFTVNPYKDTGTYVIAGVDEIQLLLDDHITKAITIKNSPYIKPFEIRIMQV